MVMRVAARIYSRSRPVNLSIGDMPLVSKPAYVMCWSKARYYTIVLVKLEPAFQWKGNAAADRCRV
jgi:hypothetical protein